MRKKYSICKAAIRLGFSRATLNKEIEEGNIIAHKRRGRIVLFEDDLQAYEERNTINNSHETTNRINTCNNLMWEGPSAQAAQAVQAVEN